MTYVKVHLRFWYLYLLTIGAMFVGFIFSLFLLRYADAVFNDLQLAKAVSAIVFSFISSFFLLIPNYFVAQQFSYDKKIRYFLSTAGNQLISVSLLFIVGYLLYFS